MAGEMTVHRVSVEVRGPWSLATSREFWEGFGPNRLAGQQPDAPLTAVFRVDTDWSRAEATVRQRGRGEAEPGGSTAEIDLSGPGDLDAAAAQVQRFLAVDVDATGWPAVGERDPVIGAAQAELPGFRPCGFYSPYEAAVWTVLSQRIRISQAASLRDRLLAEHGEEGAFPAPATLRGRDLGLPGRKDEYLQAVVEAALDGELAGAGLRELDADQAIDRVRRIKGLGPFASELVVLRGANAPDGLPTSEKRLTAEVAERYGTEASLPVVSEGWRPFRTWAAVHLRALRGRRTER